MRNLEQNQENAKNLTLIREQSRLGAVQKLRQDLGASIKESQGLDILTGRQTGQYIMPSLLANSIYHFLGQIESDTQNRLEKL
ncbi:hypothetical protein V6R21_07595 [Limibacter armeniacum]|uniref:hypothetical protein n=1 Tax=Limibacter armeniacum TaxID=466084 RepID=UPI002FE54DD3